MGIGRDWNRNRDRNGFCPNCLPLQQQFHYEIAENRERDIAQDNKLMMCDIALVNFIIPGFPKKSLQGMSCLRAHVLSHISRFPSHR